MRNFLPLGTGNSRFLKSNIPAGITFAEFVAQLRAGTLPIDLNGINSAGVSDAGTPLTKANLLADATETRLWGNASDRTVDAALARLAEGRAHYGTCPTAAATVAKTVAATGFVRATGARIVVKWTNTNTAANPTLNVNGTGAAAMYCRGVRITNTMPFLLANGVNEFVYTGSYYDLVTDDSKGLDRLMQVTTTATVATLSLSLTGIDLTRYEELRLLIRSSSTTDCYPGLRINGDASAVYEFQYDGSGPWTAGQTSISLSLARRDWGAYLTLNRAEAMVYGLVRSSANVQAVRYNGGGFTGITKLDIVSRSTFDPDIPAGVTFTLYGVR